MSLSLNKKVEKDGYDTSYLTYFQLTMTRTRNLASWSAGMSSLGFLAVPLDEKRM